jgi:hypothetical protein
MTDNQNSRANKSRLKNDASRDLAETENGNLPLNEAAYDRKFKNWKRRNWIAWLSKNLSFPVPAKRTEDDDDAYFTDIADREPFRLGHIMEVIGISSEVEPRNGIMVRVKEGRRKGWVALADLEVISKEDPNYWPVWEYTVWYANQ